MTRRQKQVSADLASYIGADYSSSYKPGQSNSSEASLQSLTPSHMYLLPMHVTLGNSVSTQTLSPDVHSTLLVFN